MSQNETVYFDLEKRGTNGTMVFAKIKNNSANGHNGGWALCLFYKPVGKCWPKYKDRKRIESNFIFESESEAISCCQDFMDILSRCATASDLYKAANTYKKFNSLNFDDESTPTIESDVYADVCFGPTPPHTSSINGGSNQQEVQDDTINDYEMDTGQSDNMSSPILHEMDIIQVGQNTTRINEGSNRLEKTREELS